MANAPFFFTLLLTIGFPILAIQLSKRHGFPSWLSPVLMCYAIGIILGNLIPDFIHKETTGQIAAGSMLISLPLLLFGANIKENWKLAGSGLKAFGLCALAGFISTCVAAWLFHEQQSDGWIVAGMLTGLYTGGTPNMQAIGMALDAPENYVVLLQAADIIGGGVFLLLLMTIIHPFLGLFLPSFTVSTSDEAEEVIDDPADKQTITWQGIALSLAIAGAAVGLTILFSGSLENTTLIIVFITTFSLAASLSPVVTKWRNAYDQGEYFLYIFCVAVGLMADFREMMGEGLPLLAFSLVALLLTILLHWLLSWIFKIDRDTVMISATAALYGPVFIAQITTAISNRRLLAPGIALSLIGLALGNYLGIAIGNLAKYLFW